MTKLKKLKKFGWIALFYPNCPIPPFHSPCIIIHTDNSLISSLTSLIGPNSSNPGLFQCKKVQTRIKRYVFPFFFHPQIAAKNALIFFTSCISFFEPHPFSTSANANLWLVIDSGFVCTDKIAQSDQTSASFFIPIQLIQFSLFSIIFGLTRFNFAPYHFSNAPNIISILPTTPQC